VLTNEKVCIAARMFDCYQVDLAEVEEGHPLLDLVKRPRPLTFHTVYAGKVLFSTGERPSSSEIVTACARILKREFGIALDTIIKAEQKLLDELDTVLIAKEKCEATRIKKGQSLSKKEDAELQKLEQELSAREAELREAERKLFDIQEYRKPANEAESAQAKS